MRRSTIRFLVVVTLVVALFLTVSVTRGARGTLSAPESWLITGVGWIQSLFHLPVQSIFAAGNKPDEETAMMELQAKVNQLQKENNELKQLLNYKKEHPMDTIAARVVYRSPDRWNNRIVINRGSIDGVKPKMPVVTARGLLGRVVNVTKYMSEIQLLTNSDGGPGIAAVIQNGSEEILGIIEGYDMEKKCLLLNKVPVTAQPKKGQFVVTSQLSDIYPGGILIGTVDQVKLNEGQVEQVVYVKPSASFERFDFVMVVKDPEKLQLNQLSEQKPSGKGGEKR
ncbi:rod shape-determining protein MreC [Thermoactinomyces mirandus]|uniref:Cell shape-determining protein MreC n=1 Tax=Thermoactinomyces mirandus TaxID=2756294 RepID=A0A7W1XSY9_9BACL|nr:rod shape-determining protein MreC [Thermoactinomyces mirandus]MBA4602718.1 rod shape-determining protein MreC [Thermoactinomyces mirandus]